MNQIIARQNLLKYIENEQIAFQFADELMSFTQLDVSGDENQKKEIEKLRNVIKHAHSIEIVNPKDVIDYRASDIGFNVFVKWSQPQDLLILVDGALLLCLSNRDKCRIFFEPMAC